MHRYKKNIACNDNASSSTPKTPCRKREQTFILVLSFFTEHSEFPDQAFQPSLKQPPVDSHKIAWRLAPDLPQ